MSFPRALRCFCLPAMFIASAGALQSGPPDAGSKPLEASSETEAREMTRALVSGDERLEELVSRQLVQEGTNAIPVLAILLANPDPRVCGFALALTGRLHAAEKPLVPRLGALLRHPDVDVRSQAARAIGRVGPAAAEAVPALVDAMLDPSLRIQGEAARAVASQDDNAEGPLIDQLRFPSTAYSARAFDMLLDPAMNLGPGARGLVDRVLVRALRKNGDPAIRRQAALVLRRIGITSDAALFALLHTVETDESTAARVAAARTLEEVNENRRDLALRKLREIRDDLDSEVDHAIDAAIQALGKRP